MYYLDAIKNANEYIWRCHYFPSDACVVAREGTHNKHIKQRAMRSSIIIPGCASRLCIGTVTVVCTIN